MERKILVLGNYHDAIYHPFDGVDERLKEILQNQKLVCSDDTYKLLELKEGFYAGVISYLDIWQSTLTDEETAALCHFVEQGGFLLILHNGISIQGKASAMELMGGKFLTHPAMEHIRFDTKPHPITEGCAAFELPEEPYQFEMVQDEKQVFLEYIYHDKKYPAGWSKEVKKGKVVFLMPGHTPEIFDTPEYRSLIQKSVEWCEK